MLPAKRMIGNLTAAVIEERRQGLERYLQRLVNGEKEVVFSPALLKFLEVNEHNVIWVAQHLARHLQLYGERTLRASRLIGVGPDWSSFARVLPGPSGSQRSPPPPTHTHIHTHTHKLVDSPPRAVKCRDLSSRSLVVPSAPMPRSMGDWGLIGSDPAIGLQASFRPR